MNRTVEYWQKRIIELKLCPYQDRINELRHKAIDISKNIVIIEARGWVTIHGKHVYLADNGKGGKVRISRSELNKISRKIDDQFYMYYGKEKCSILSHELNAYYEFENHGFGDYVIIRKKGLKD